jgi:hypothetical protein
VREGRIKKRFHLNCGTMQTPLGVCLFGVGRPFRRAPVVSHCILVESDEGLLLIDMGMGTADLAHPDPFLRLVFWLGGSK